MTPESISTPVVFSAYRGNGFLAFFVEMIWKWKRAMCLFIGVLSPGGTDSVEMAWKRSSISTAPPPLKGGAYGNGFCNWPPALFFLRPWTTSKTTPGRRHRNG